MLDQNYTILPDCEEIDVEQLPIPNKKVITAKKREIASDRYQSEVTEDDSEEKESSQKSPILWGILICAAVGNLTFMNIVSILPLYINENHKTINDTQVGVLLASYQVGFLLAAPIIGASLGSWGRRRTILIGMLLTGFATAIFACAAFFKNTMVFYSVSLTGRLI